jgi:SAM-dependent methyltransferase
MTDNRCYPLESGSREWFRDWFNHPLYLTVYLHRDRKEARLCVDTILRVTGIGNDPASTDVLDIACGAGRHAVEFARYGFRVTANDLSPNLLELARESAVAEGLSLRFSESDMRSISPEGAFGLVVQLFSSFGYFASENEDRTVIGNVSNLLLPGGWYVLDLINPDHLRYHLTGRSERTVDRLSIVEERVLSGNRVTKTITVCDEDGKSRAFTESVRLYDKGEISRMLEDGGLDVVCTAGDYAGSPFDSSSSPRLILFSRKRLMLD